VASATLAVSGSLLVVAPAQATFYDGGNPNAFFTIQPYSYNDLWQPALDQALTNWFNTPTPAWIFKDSTSPNVLDAQIFSDTWYGLYQPFGTRDTRTYRISLNSSTIARDATDFQPFVTSVFVHELGHGLSLDHTSEVSIMNPSRDRNTMTTPQQYDIDEVNRIY
jgi:hypothetical protein